MGTLEKNFLDVITLATRNRVEPALKHPYRASTASMANPLSPVASPLLMPISTSPTVAALPLKPSLEPVAGTTTIIITMPVCSEVPSECFPKSINLQRVAKVYECVQCQQQTLTKT